MLTWRVLGGVQGAPWPWAAAGRRPPGHGEWAASSPAIGLVRQVDAALDWRVPRIVQFIAAHSREGVSTVATAYAEAAAGKMKRSVLLVCDGATIEGQPLPGLPPLPGLIDTMVAGRDLADVSWALRPGLAVCRLLADPRLAGESLPTIARAEFWSRLRDTWAEVVVDSPAVSRSQVGLATAAHGDAVVVVVEAERTRAPVAARLITDLAAAGGNVVGSVLTKRRLYIPAFLYDRL